MRRERCVGSVIAVWGCPGGALCVQYISSGWVGVADNSARSLLHETGSCNKCVFAAAPRGELGLGGRSLVTVLLLSGCYPATDDGRWGALSGGQGPGRGPQALTSRGVVSLHQPPSSSSSVSSSSELRMPACHLVLPLARRSSTGHTPASSSSSTGKAWRCPCGRLERCSSAGNQPVCAGGWVGGGGADHAAQQPNQRCAPDSPWATPTPTTLELTHIKSTPIPSTPKKRTRGNQRMPAHNGRMYTHRALHPTCVAPCAPPPPKKHTHHPQLVPRSLLPPAIANACCSAAQCAPGHVCMGARCG